MYEKHNVYARKECTLTDIHDRQGCTRRFVTIAKGNDMRLMDVSRSVGMMNKWKKDIRSRIQIRSPAAPSEKRNMCGRQLD
jgi:hypothetical protein